MTTTTATADGATLDRHPFHIGGGVFVFRLGHQRPSPDYLLPALACGSPAVLYGLCDPLPSLHLAPRLKLQDAPTAGPDAVTSEFHIRPRWACLTWRCCSRIMRSSSRIRRSRSWRCMSGSIVPCGPCGGCGGPLRFSSLTLNGRGMPLMSDLLPSSCPQP